MREQRTRARRRARRGTILTVSMLATFAFVAAVFAGTAAALPTALCKASEEVCHEGHTYPAGTELEATSTDFKIETEIGTYSCSEAVARFTTTDSAGEPLVADVNDFYLTGCKAPLYKDCKVTTTAFGELNVADPYGGDSALGEFTDVSWNWYCSNPPYFPESNLGLWDGSGLQAEMEGGSPASFHFEKHPIHCFEGKGTLCPGSGWLTAHFTIKTPQPLHFAEGGEGLKEEGGEETSLCETNETYCAEENRYPSDTAVKASLAKPLAINNSLAAIKCSSMSLEAKTTAKLEAPLPASIVSWGGFGGCGTNKTMDNCTLTVTEAAAGASLQTTGSGQGTLTLGSKTPLKFHAVCTKVLGFIKVDCEFVLESHATLAGGSPASIAANDPLKMIEGGGFCPEKPSFEATYTVNAPNPVYVSN